MNVLVLRGYYSKDGGVSYIDFNGLKIKVTTVALGQPVFVKRRLKKIIHKYQINNQNYDLIYAISMSAGISSLVDEKLYKKLHLITPFFIHHKTMLILRKFKLRKFLGAYFLLLVNGRLGKFDKSIKVTLAEHDNIADNNFFQNTWDDVNLIKDFDHYITAEVVENIIKKDIKELEKIA